jgi:hypothetical protein
MFERIIMVCTELFTKLSNPEITYDEYKALIPELQRISDPTQDCIDAFCEFVKKPPFQDLSTVWYAQYLLNDVMKTGAAWIYRNKFDPKKAENLIFNCLKLNSLFIDSFSFDSWEFLEYLIHKYFDHIGSEEQLEILTIIKKLFLESNSQKYKVLEVLEATLEESRYSVSDIDFGLPELISMVKMPDYLTLSSVVDFLKLIIKDEKVQVTKEQMFELIEESLLILENHPADDLRLVAVKILQLFWINIFPPNEDISPKVSQRFVMGLLSELKKYQKGIWRDLINIEEVEDYFYSFLTGLRDKFSMVRAEISFMAMLIPLDLYSLSQKELVLEWYEMKRGEDM